MMNTPMRPSPRHVPTLTEVIDLHETPAAQAVVADVVLDPAPKLADAPAALVEPVAPGVMGAALEAQISQRVMADLQRQIDGMLEYRLREALAPILARTSEALVRELRQELSKTMKDVVARSVAQEVARQRSRG